MELCRSLIAFGRIYYRHRYENRNRKSDNIHDFLELWGGRYKYFVVLDADSLMCAPALCHLVNKMEKNPQLGILQTVPGMIGAKTGFGRIQQFTNRFYGKVAAAGLDFWQQDGGNYWGHNAIIRTQPFIEYCGLPTLPWREPIGGKILSHDLVEAALMRRGGYEIRLDLNKGDSFEEGPPTCFEMANRDRRWCQGNL